MSTTRSPQLGRIARVMHVDVEELHGLDGLTDEQLRRLHDRIGELVFAGEQDRFARIAGLSKAIPGPLAGKLAERFLPPPLAARTAEMLEPAKARDLVTKVRTSYLADLAMSLDPTRSKTVVQAIPPNNVAQVARELFGRGEYAAMAEFAGTVTLGALFGAFEVATPHDLFEVAPLLVWNDNLDTVLSELPVEKILPLVHELVRTSREEAGSGSRYTVIDRMAPVMACVPTERVAEVARVLFEQGDYEAMAQFAGTVPLEALTAAFDVAAPHDLFQIAPLLVWNDNLTQVLSDLPVNKIVPLVEELVRASREEADDGGGATLIERLAAVMACVPAERVGAVAAVLFERGEYRAMALFSGVVPPASILAAVAAANARDLLGVVPLLEWNDNLATAINDLPISVVDDILHEVIDGDLWSEASYLIDRLDPRLIDHALSRVRDLPAASFAVMRAAADAGQLTGQACDLLDRAERLRTDR
ncbi:MAG: hypothetical protein M3O28_04950 [Actinomycetota bacterium]|nr:hypothetical protein [Actinomycetota bacterium]